MSPLLIIICLTSAHSCFLSLS